MKHKETITLYKKYSFEEYTKYDNYDAINVNKYTEISYDYNRIMGVSIIFLDKFNLNQFEILEQMVTTKVDDYNFDYHYINGKRIYARVLIKRKVKNE